MEKKFGNSKLQELLDKYCPNGVEYKPLGKVTLMRRGSSLTKKDIVEGNYPVISGGREPAYYCDKFNREHPVVTVAGSGAGAGYVQYFDTPVYANDCFTVEGNDNVITKYIYYVLSGLQGKISNCKKGSGVPHVHIVDIEQFQIPIPPMPVQEEIVRILDSFTALETALVSELEMRKKQYEYYRDNLLDFEMFSKENISALRTQIDKNTVELSDVQKFVWELVQKYATEGVEYDKVSSVSDFKNGKGHEQSINIDGKYIVINSKYISSDSQVLKFSNEQLVPLYINDVVMVMSDLPNGKALAKCFLIDENNKYTLNQRICSLTVRNQNVLLPKYFYYVLNRNRGLLKYDNGCDQTNLKKDEVISVRIPIPPKPMQEEIVKILDAFSDLTTDIQKGLPAEIEMRRKQYEYYRDKLLSFDRADGRKIL